MVMLVNGEWHKQPVTTDEQGRFIRRDTTFRDWVTADGAGGYKAEAGRYHLYVSYACPWAHRVLIMRALKGLQDAISLSVVDPFMSDEGWHFSDNPDCIPDPIHNARYLREVYVAAKLDYTGRVTVPALWDKQTGTLVNNESRDLIRMLDTEFDAVAEHPRRYLPPERVQQVDAAIDAIYQPINNGVYRSGFATTQDAYEEAVTELFRALDHWEQVLGRQRYLAGDTLTEADWCLFTTLVRFDPVYHYHFKCNLRRIADYPNLWNYLKELYQVPGVAKTVHFGHIKHHYYASHESVNPTRIVPKGPVFDLTTPHDRATRTYAAA